MFKWFSEAEIDRNRLEREMADSAKRLKFVVDQRKELSDRVAELERLLPGAAVVAATWCRLVPEASGSRAVKRVILS